MITEKFNTFIKKYSLGKIINKTKWKYDAEKKIIHTRAVADNKAFLMDVVMHNTDDFGSDSAIICIGDSERLRNMLTPFGDEISLSLNMEGDKVLGFGISNSDVECYVAAADASILDPVPKTLNPLTDFDVIVPLTPEIMEKFLKAKMALKDIDSFSVTMNAAGKFDIVIGYTTSNSNRIRITPETDPVKNKLKGGSMSFTIANVYEAMKTNFDMTESAMLVHSEAGLIQLYFKNDDYTCNYYQFANTKNK